MLIYKLVGLIQPMANWEFERKKKFITCIISFTMVVCVWLFVCNQECNRLERVHKWHSQVVVLFMCLQYLLLLPRSIHDDHPIPIPCHPSLAWHGTKEPHRSTLELSILYTVLGFDSRPHKKMSGCCFKSPSVRRPLDGH